MYSHLIILIVVGVDVVVHRFGGVLEVVVVDVLGDAVEEEGVGEHGGHVGDVPVVDISGPAVVLQHVICLHTGEPFPVCFKNVLFILKASNY